MRRAALVILDGWGHRPGGEHNAVATARTPRLTQLFDTRPWTTLDASGLSVGLPDAQMGNSEVGHLNLGAGRVVYQELTRIHRAIEDGSFFDNPVLLEACDRARETGGRLHLLGLLSDGGVHSHQDHLVALVDLARRRGLDDVCVHAFLDGRDTPPRSGGGYLARLEADLDRLGVGRVATITGRFYAMDRDNRWDRVERAYRALVRGEGHRATSPAQAIEAAYAADQSDEFVEPRVVVGSDGAPAGSIRDGDAVVFFNFRADRAREITRAFTEEGFCAFDSGDRPKLARYATFTGYDEGFHLPVAFPPEHLDDILAQVVSRAGGRQLRIAETEKYAHVTYFFNGGEEAPVDGEDRVLVPSPREVKTYDEKPEMSAFAVRDRLVAEIEGGGYDLIVVNFANCDMVGHTGIEEAAVRAVEAVDTCVGDVVRALGAGGYATLITADHGNAEQMWDETTGQAHTAHTTNPVPFLLVDDLRPDATLRAGGILADVAPTLLEAMALAVPSAMTGQSLVEK